MGDEACAPATTLYGRPYTGKTSMYPGMYMLITAKKRSELSTNPTRSPRFVFEGGVKECEGECVPGEIKYWYSQLNNLRFDYDLNFRMVVAYFPEECVHAIVIGPIRQTSKDNDNRNIMELVEYLQIRDNLHFQEWLGPYPDLYLAGEM